MYLNSAQKTAILDKSEVGMRVSMECRYRGATIQLSGTIIAMEVVSQKVVYHVKLDHNDAYEALTMWTQKVEHNKLTF